MQREPDAAMAAIPRLLAASPAADIRWGMTTVDELANQGGNLSDAEHQRLRSEEHTSELQSPCNLVCRLLLEKKNIDRDRKPALDADEPATSHAERLTDYLIVWD